ncbi:MAG: hypothetical protein K2H21_00245 [Muribaculaceae bacterium]|nr:hypothetical protein [Muribaculaceae bacterium]
MDKPIIVWCVIAGVLLFAFVLRAIERYYTKCHHNGHRPRHLFELGREKEMFYIPGDADDEDFDEL